MTVWKLSIKTNSQKDFNPLIKCKEKSLVGAGWHRPYINNHPQDLLHAKKILKDYGWEKWPYQLTTLMEKVKKDDYIWIHQSGAYYLCKVNSDKCIFGKDIDIDFAKFDLGHAREVEYVKVDEKFVSGKIQRGTIAQRTIQRIKLSVNEKDYVLNLFEKLNLDPKWEPSLINLENKIKQSNYENIFAALSPDDTEDVLAAYLQSLGWIIVKSTCFRSKSKFEFEMLNKNGDTGYIQIKTGRVTLNPDMYKKFLGNKIKIFLFSTAKNPYPKGINIPGIEAINQLDIYKWLITNTWALPLSLKYRLAISL